jgi:hypothetical protein
LSAQGILPGATISSIAWNRTSNFGMAGTGNAIFKVYAKNSAATVATNETWASITTGASLVVDQLMNTTNDLPLTTGWWTLNFSTPFTYTGGSLEIAVDWDCFGVSGNPTTGAFNWSVGTTTANLTSYSNNSSQVTSTATVSSSRPNIQITYTNAALACPPITGLTVTGTTSSASLAWTAGGAETAWNIEYGPFGFVQGTGTVVTSNTTSATITGLTPNTNYSFYVQADCADEGTSFVIGPVSFLTGYCVNTSTSALSYFNAFTTTGGSTNISNTASGYATGGYQDATAMVVSQYAGGTVNFTTSLVGTTVGVAIWVDWNNNLLFEVSERVYNTGAYVSTASGTITVPAGTPVGSYRMRAVMDYNATNPSACSPGTRSETEDYTFAVVALPSCVPPTTLTATNLTATGASLGWTVLGTETAWDIEYGVSGFTQGTGTTVNATTNPYALSGLSANTAYQFYVRANCGGGSTSTWAGPFTFTTPCVAYSVPYFEGFETGYTQATTVAGCLSQASVAGTSSWAANNTLTTYNRAPYAGAWNAYLPYSNDDWLFIPINLTGGTSYTFECYARQDGATATDANVAISYGSSNSAAAMTNAIVPATGIINGNYQLITGTFTPANSGVYYVGIKGYMNSTPWYISLDNVAVFETPNCPKPTFLTATNVTMTSATLNWTENGTATSWDIEYGVSGFAPGTGTMITGVTSKPYNLTGVTPLMNYQFYVRSGCATAPSDWAGPASFSTNYCTPAPSSVDAQGITNVTIGTINNTTVAEAGNYGNYTSQVTDVRQGNAVPVSITLKTGYTYNMWAFIDWNDDLDFADAGETQYLGESTSANPTTLVGSISVPTGAALGQHRLRIGGADGGMPATGTPNPCYTGTYGTFEDYTVNVVVDPCVGFAASIDALGHETCQDNNDGYAELNATMSGVVYQWSDGVTTTSGRSDLLPGTYTIYASQAMNVCYDTLNIVINAGGICYPDSCLVTWTGVVGASVTSTILRKTTTVTGWSAGARSTSVLSAGADGWAEMSVTATNKNRMFGLSTSADSTFDNGITYGISLKSTGSVDISENKVIKGSHGTYAIGDKFRVERIGGTVNYLKNGVIFYTSATPSTTPLVVDASLNSNASTINNAYSSFGCTAIDACAGFAITGTKTDEICLGANNGSISVTSNRANTVYQWLDNASTAANRTNLAPGTYTVAASVLGTACVDTLSFIIKAGYTFTTAILQVVQVVIMVG